MNIKDYEIIKLNSIQLFKVATDPLSLVGIDIDKDTLEAVINKFLNTKASKTDLSVLIGLMEFWNKETSFIDVNSFDDFRIKTGLNLVNANLSRSLKALEKFEFIERVDSPNKIKYLFNIPYKILRFAV